MNALYLNKLTGRGDRRLALFSDKKKNQKLKSRRDLSTMLPGNVSYDEILTVPEQKERRREESEGCLADGAMRGSQPTWRVLISRQVGHIF